MSNQPRTKKGLTIDAHSTNLGIRPLRTNHPPPPCPPSRLTIPIILTHIQVTQPA